MTMPANTQLEDVVDITYGEEPAGPPENLDELAAQSQEAGEGSPAGQTPTPPPPPQPSPEMQALIAQNAQTARELAATNQRLDQFLTPQEVPTAPVAPSMEVYEQWLDQTLPQQYADPSELAEAKQAFMGQYRQQAEAVENTKLRTNIEEMRQEMQEIKTLQQTGGQRQWTEQEYSANLNMASVMGNMVGINVNPQDSQQITDIFAGVTHAHSIEQSYPIVQQNLLRISRGETPQPGYTAQGAVNAPPPNMAPSPGGMPPNPPPLAGAGVAGRRFNNLEEVSDAFMKDNITGDEYEQYSRGYL